MKKIGFIGVGIMGKSMVRNLRKAGFELHIYARHPEKVQDVAAEGAVLHESIAACAQASQIIITMVGFPEDVEEVYFAQGNLFDSAAPDTWLIDMTTTSPSLAQHLFLEGKKRGLHVLDAPVTGGDMGAKNGTLSILVGGERADFERCIPLFRAMGSNINYQGPAGYGQYAKMANQIMIAGTLSGICEAIAYAEQKGLDPKLLLASISTGAAGSRQLDTLGEKIIDGDYAPGFFMNHFIKDMGLALESAEENDLQLPVLGQVLAQCQGLEAQGMGKLGTQALIQYYRQQ